MNVARPAPASQELPQKLPGTTVGLVFVKIVQLELVTFVPIEQLEYGKPGNGFSFAMPAISASWYELAPCDERRAVSFLAQTLFGRKLSPRALNPVSMTTTPSNTWAECDRSEERLE